MKKCTLGQLLLWSLALLCLWALPGMAQSAPAAPPGAPPVPAIDENVSQGALRVQLKDRLVECPLKHTDVVGSISGFIARVTVTQTFQNPFDDKIEAVYVFPLPHTAAVDDMTMMIGDRKIVGVIKRRAEARHIYEQAIAQGNTAALLEQERPNIFTQTVGNIPPKSEIKVVISYVDVLAYDMGGYEFHFPMVVSPRYDANKPFTGVPAGATVAPPIAAPVGIAPAGATAPVGVNPPILLPDTRNGADISLSLKLNTGVPVQDIKVTNHKAKVEKTGATLAEITLDPSDSIPNKDFVVRYTVAGSKPEMAVLANSAGLGKGYFMLMIQPATDDKLMKSPPREMIFLVDVSGSMGGAKTDKAKEAMKLFFKQVRPDDTINVITFDSTSRKFFPASVPATKENMEKALNYPFTGGGTEMHSAVKMAIDEPVDAKRVRMVIMLTDGETGDEANLTAMIGKAAGDNLRFSAFGIGTSANRFLVDNIAKQGKGVSGIIDLTTDPAELVIKTMDRLHRAQLANVQIDWQGLSVNDIYPRRIPDLWAGAPIILYGRYEDGGTANINVNGTIENKTSTQALTVSLPYGEYPANEVLAPVWARQKIEDLSQQMYYGNDPVIIEEITKTALEYKLMSQYTSFVAVDVRDLAKTTTPVKPPRRVNVAVPLAADTQWSGVFASTSISAIQLMSNEYADRIPLIADHWNNPAVPGIAGSNGLTRYELAQPSARFMMASPSTAPFSSSMGTTTAGIVNSYASIDTYGITLGVISPSSTSPVISTIPLIGSVVYPNKQMPAPPAAIIPTGAASLMGYSRATIDLPGDAGGLWKDGASLKESPKYRLRQDGKDETGAPLTGAALAASNNLATMYAQMEKAAAAAEFEAGVQQARGHFDTAIACYQQAILLNMALGKDIAKLSAAMNLLPEQQENARVVKYPALGRMVGQELHNISISDAVKLLAGISGMDVSIVGGSLEDAADMTASGKLPIIAYLDLRNANVAMALNMILSGNHLDWVAQNGGIIVATSHRLPATSAWVYPVHYYQQPANQEEYLLNADKFLRGARLALGADGNASVYFLGENSNLLVIGDSTAHARIAAYLQALRAGTDMTLFAGPSPSEFTDWMKSREARKNQQANLLLLQELQKTAGKYANIYLIQRISQRMGSGISDPTSILNSYGWRLFTSAYAGKMDVEALGWLEGVWYNPDMAKLIEGNFFLFARSAWQINAAATKMPKDADLAKLAAQVRAVMTPYTAKFANFDSMDNANLLGVDYLLLAGMLTDAQRAELGKVRADKSLTRALLDPSKENVAALQGSLDNMNRQQYLEDNLLLTALIAKKQGGPLAKALRENLRDIVKGYPVNSSLLLLVNELTK